VDGHTASSPTESTAERLALNFTHPIDQHHMQKIVAASDAVFIGARSLAAERGAFRVASLRATLNSSVSSSLGENLDSNFSSRNPEPAWVIFSGSGKLNFEHGFWKQKGIRKFIVTLSFDVAPLCLQSRDIFGEEVIVLKGTLPDVLAYFNAHGVARASLLGGATLSGLFWAAQCVDVLHLTVCPYAVGKSNAPGVLDSSLHLAQRLELLSCATDEGFVFLEYKVVGNELD